MEPVQVVEPVVDLVVEPEPQPEPEPQAGGGAEPEPEEVFESEADTEPAVEPEPEAEPEVELEVGLVIEPESGTESRPGTEGSHGSGEPPTAALLNPGEIAGGVMANLFSNEKTPVGPVIMMRLDVSIGTNIAGKEVSITATGLKPHSEVTLVVHSEPRVLARGFADENGYIRLSAIMPDDLGAGIHTIIAQGTGALGELIQAVSVFEIDAENIVISFMPPSQVMEPVEPGDRSLLRAMRAGVPLYDPQRYPGTVAGMTLAVCVAGGGMGAMAGLKKPQKGMAFARAGKGRKEEEEEHGERVGAGDRGFLWRLLPFVSIFDRLGLAMQNFAARYSTMLHRVAGDGVWARAMFGSGGYLLWVAGIILGFMASSEAGFRALPPNFTLVLVIVVLGVLDAGAGFLAWFVAMLLSLFSGNITGVDDVTTLIGLFTLYSSLTLLSGTRPLRREYRPGRKFIFDRVTDYIVPTAYLMLVSSAVLDVINGLSGLLLFTPENSTAIRITVVLAIWLRLAFEDIVTNFFPNRLTGVRSEAPVQQKLPFLLGAVVMYVSIFVLVSKPFFGLSAALFVLLALDIVPTFLTFFEEKLPNSKFLHKWYPDSSSTYASLVLTVIGIFLGFWLLSSTGDYRRMSTVLVILAIPYALAEIPAIFGRKGYESGDGWARRIGEVTCWVLFALIALDIVTLI